MPTRVFCPECHQRLSVDAHDVGRPIKCPRCRRIIRVPVVASGTEDVAGRSDAPAGAEPPLVLVSGPSSHGPAGSTSVRPRVTDDGAGRVLVPRAVVACQGLLLGGVALVFFIFGLIVGGHSRPSAEDTPGAPVTVSGTVRYTDATRQAVPDTSSCVLLLPVATRPDQKAAAEGLRPRDAAPEGAHPSVAAIRAIGGDVARVDRRGRYRLRAAAPARYFLLIVSRHARRREGEPPAARDLAELGRYVLPATTLLENQQYLWRELPVRADLRVDHTF